MPFAYFYGRVSHETSSKKRDTKFSDRCVSVDVQFKMCQDRLLYDIKTAACPPLEWSPRGWVGTKRQGNDTTDGCYVDQEVSAFKVEWNQRPAGGRCQLMLKPGDSLYVAYLDRMFRRNRDQANTLHHFLKHKIRVVFVNENLDSNNEYHLFLMQILSSFSELDSRNRSRRNKEIAAFRRARGEVCNGCAPRGFKHGPGGKGIPDDDLRRLKLQVLHLIDVEKLTFLAASHRVERELAAKENRVVLPEQKGDRLPARRYSAKTIERIYRDDTIRLPSEMLPPGTFDAIPQAKPEFLHGDDE